MFSSVLHDIGVLLIFDMRILQIVTSIVNTDTDKGALCSFGKEIRKLRKVIVNNNIIEVIIRTQTYLSFP